MTNNYFDRPEIFLCHKVREAFKSQKFAEVELWKLFGANITLTYWANKRNRKKVYREIIYFIYVFILQDLHKWIIYSIKYKIIYKRIRKNLVLIEALSDEQRLRELWLPVATKLEKDKCVIITEDINVYIKYKNRFEVLLLHKYGFKNWIKSKFYILKNIGKFYQIFSEVSTGKLIGRATIIHFISILIIQINRVVKTEYLYKQIKPKTFLTVWDWYPLGAAICTVLAKFGVPTITYIHGAIGRQSYIEFTPLNANFIISWGKHNTKLLVENGVKRNQILECGIQRHTKPDDIDLSTQDINYIQPGIKRTIVIPFTAFITENWISDINSLIELLSKKYRLICRPHPSTSNEIIEKMITSKEGIEIIYPKDETLQDTLSIADYVVIDSSTAGFDALLLNKMVFVLDTGEILKTQDVMADACEAKAAILCRSIDELIREIDLIETDIQIRNTIQKNAINFINNFIKAYGQEATDNIVNEIEKIIF